MVINPYQSVGCNIRPHNQGPSAEAAKIIHCIWCTVIKCAFCKYCDQPPLYACCAHRSRVFTLMYNALIRHCYHCIPLCLVITAITTIRIPQTTNATANRNPSEPLMTVSKFTVESEPNQCQHQYHIIVMKNLTTSLVAQLQQRHTYYGDYAYHFQDPDVVYTSYSKLATTKRFTDTNRS